MKCFIVIVVLVSSNLVFASREYHESKRQECLITAMEAEMLVTKLDADLDKLRREIVKLQLELEKLPLVAGNEIVDLARKLGIDSNPSAKLKFEEQRQEILYKYRERQSRLTEELSEKRISLIEIESVLDLPPTVIPRRLPTKKP